MTRVNDPWLAIVGIGDDGPDGLAPRARTVVEAAETLVGGDRHLAFFEAHPAEKLPWASPFADSAASIRTRSGRRVVVLASGDPMWFGAGATLARLLPEEFASGAVEVLPHPGAFALAASRLGWALAEALCLSACGRPLEPVLADLALGARLLVLSADGATPAALARLLVQAGWGPSRLTVLEHLGGPHEARHAMTAEAWGDRQTADLNTVAIEAIPAAGTQALSRVPGRPIDAFDHDGQITKAPIRALVLAALGPLPGELLWDVGGGSGSVAIEWLRAVPRTRAVAIEKRGDRAGRIRANAARLGVPDLKVVEGTAPDALAGLPPPDAVFVGGGITTPGLVDACWAALKPGGRLVADVVTVEGEAALAVCHARLGGELLRIATSQAEPVGGFHGWRPAMAVTQWIVRKPGNISESQ